MPAPPPALSVSEVAEGKQGKTIEGLESLMREGRIAEVVLATDPDREGGSNIGAGPLIVGSSFACN